METPAFAPALLAGKSTFTSSVVAPRSIVRSHRPIKVSRGPRMTFGDYMARSVTRQYKQFAVNNGEYNVQCTEGTTPGAAEAKRVAVLAECFRARQASPSERYADLYATRRAAIVGAHGCHHEETQMCTLPVMASAYVIGKAEAMRACNRYFTGLTADAKYMNYSVDVQYKAKNVPNGVFGTSCTEGTVRGQAEEARVQGLGTAFRANHFSTSEKTQARYNASLNAIALYAKGCDYEESLFMKYPMAAGAMRASTGVYGAGASGPAGYRGPAEGKEVLPLAVRLQGPNRNAIWPSNLRRPAVQREQAFWWTSPVKNYGAMSAAAVAYGEAAQSGSFKSGAGDVSWSPGWQPRSSVVP